MRGLLKLNTLAGKLILAVSVLLFCGSLLFGYIYFNYQERVMFENIEAHARLAVDLAARGVRHGMLTADGTVIQQAVDTLSSAEDVLLIRIYDTKGKVAYSSPHPRDERAAVLHGPLPFPQGERTDTRRP
jgi:hypothetical protein